MTIAEAIDQASRRLHAAGVPAAPFDAELLLRHVLGRDRAWIITHGTDPLDGKHLALFEDAVRRREKREPLQHIIGTQEFWGLDFIVTRDVLIPRPETELAVEAVVAAAKEHRPQIIVDVCTGSACIAVSIAKALPEVRIFATDRSEKALEIARLNAQRHEVSGRIRFLEGDLFAPLEELDLRGRVDIITANPPYVRSGDLPLLQPEVRDYEPGIALVAGADGTEIAERIIAAAPEYLRSGGSLVMEMGMDQAGSIVSMVERTKAYAQPALLKDLLEIDRVIIAKKL